MKLIAGKPIFAPPKGGKIREVALPEWVAVALAEHVRRHPPIEVTRPWRVLDGEPRTSRLNFTSRESRPINRNYFNPYIWKPSLKAVDIATTRLGRNLWEQGREPVCGGQLDGLETAGGDQCEEAALVLGPAAVEQQPCGFGDHGDC